MTACECNECDKSTLFCKKCGSKIIQRRDYTFVCSNLHCIHGEYFVPAFYGIPDFVQVRERSHHEKVTSRPDMEDKKMKLYLEFESDGTCRNCPACVNIPDSDFDYNFCNELSEKIPWDYKKHPNCPARLSPNDEIRTGEIAALKAEIQRLQAIIRGEV